MAVEEIWRDVPTYENIYQVSNLGHVRRIKQSRGSGFRTNMKSAPNHYGYSRLSLCKNNRPKQHLVHILVANAFLGPCPAGYEVNHKDGVKTNPRLDNIEYVTSKENSEHATALGLMPFGTRRTNAKLDDDKIREIRRLRSAGWLQKDIALRFGVSRRTVGDVINRKLWSHVVS